MESSFKKIGAPEFMCRHKFFAQLLSLTAVGVPGEWKNAAMEWAQKLAMQKGAWMRYWKQFFLESNQAAQPTSINWDDMRIREWSKEEPSDNRQWLFLSASLIHIANVREVRRVCSMIISLSHLTIHWVISITKISWRKRKLKMKPR